MMFAREVRSVDIGRPYTGMVIHYHAKNNLSNRKGMMKQVEGDVVIGYADAPDAIAPEQLAGFFVGWPSPPSPSRHLDILRGSAAVVLAIDEATGRVVGFINAIGDGILSAYIPLLEVLPEYRGRGIGGELVRRMLARLGEHYMIDLLCDPELQPFYERFGMRRSQGMAVRNYDRQSGEPAG